MATNEPIILDTTAQAIVVALNNLTHIGDIGSLKTSDKTNIVNAINTLVANGNDINDILPKNAAAHNSVFRGKNITGQLNAAYTAINAGTFDDVFVGDYFTKNVGGTNYTFRIGELDRFYNMGDIALTRHHALVLPDENMGNAQMNTSNVTDGGYAGSAMRTKTLAAINTNLSTAFGSHLITHRDFFSNTVKNGQESAGAAYDSIAELLSEDEAYGTHIYQSATTYFTNGVAHGMLPLFALAPGFRCNRSDWWLRSVVTAATFCVVSHSGIANAYNASDSLGVRPRFLIG